MELSSSQEAEIPMPLNSAYGGVHSHGHHGHMTHHHHHHFNQHQDPPPPSSQVHDHDHIIPSSNINIPNINNGTSALNVEDDEDDDHDKSTGGGDEIRDCNPYMKTGPVVVLSPPPTTTKKEVGVIVRYRECQKNHAASMGGNATDGCGEFMPGGEEGSFEALICSACNCHRNFHRKEIEGGHNHEDQNQQQQYSTHSHHFYHSTPHHLLNSRGRKVIGGVSQGFLGYPTTGALIPAAHVTRAIPINMPYQVGPSSDQSDDHHHHHHGNGGGGGGSGSAGVMVRPPHQLVKKRFRTKFSQEQKEKMLGFAEKVGWKIQKQEESVVQQFCQEVGVKRRVLKVWMHNNKHTFANKKNNTTTTNTNNNPNTSITNNNNNSSLLD